MIDRRFGKSVYLRPKIVARLEGILDPGRLCGDCSVCCTVLSIKGVCQQLEKCRFQVPSGCKIYSSRPRECRSYWCLYRLGGPFDARPDTAGILVEGTTHPDSVWQVWILAEHDPKAMNEILEYAAASRQVVIFRAGDEVKLAAWGRQNEPVIADQLTRRFGAGWEESCVPPSNS